jgi:hypothetical protein
VEFSRRMFKPSTSFIHVLFSEHLAFQFGFSQVTTKFVLRTSILLTAPPPPKSISRNCCNLGFICNLLGYKLDSASTALHSLTRRVCQTLPPEWLNSSWEAFRKRLHCRLRVFENRVLSTIFDHRSKEVRANSSKLHNVELYNLHTTKYRYLLGGQMKKDEMRRAYSMHGK